MTQFIQSFLVALKPAFSYQATFQWFVVACAGLILRHDCLGVTSIIRALILPVSSYPSLIHFFHSSAWSTSSLVTCWIRWLCQQHAAFTVAGRIVLIGDHTKTPKDGRRIPVLTTLRQDSESAAKPSFFRGHEWGCVALLVAAKNKFFATPLSARIHNDSTENGSRIQRLVAMAGHAAQQMATPAYLVLDAFFAAGPAFTEAAAWNGYIHILTRAKKNVTAYIPAEKDKEIKPGRPRIYGEKLKLMALFDEWKAMFMCDTLPVYGSSDVVSYLIVDLMWKPTKGLLRFFLIETSRGRIILMTSDRTMTHSTALSLYCHRTTIEVLFDAFKNTLAGLKYHFWSRYLTPTSRKPKKGRQTIPISTNPAKTEKTISAIEKFVTLHLVLIGFLQILALRFPEKIRQTARCWLRTDRTEIPSEFVTQTALANLIRSNLDDSGDDLITRFIQNKRKTTDNKRLFRKVA